ncbi:protein kinase [Nonomuraea typhae]|uniref:non-specific serine/threonine protein kinase n=1 Tax=Nonomuraea typhae TaxID=2603600 RepID=A0ABW7YWT5_9ACTN
MAHLNVMGDYQGPGEQKTAETLARDLPDDWEVIAGRKIGGPDRADLDLVIVGERAIYVVEEKSWGPRIMLSDQIWNVGGDPRRNPLDRANHLARVLAGQLRTRVTGYVSASRGRHLVKAGVILSHDALQLSDDGSYQDGDAVTRLAEAVHRLRTWDASFGLQLQPVRDGVISFLKGLPHREPRPTKIGTYTIVQELAPIGAARCFHAKAGEKTVILRCYPMHGWGPDVSPRELMDRERKAIDRLDESGRTWQIYPSFEHEAHQWFVVPVVPARGKSLATSLKINDPARDHDGLPREVVVKVVRDAFSALAEVHEAGLVHRGLCPVRIYFGRGLRVKFSDFYLSRLSGAQTIGPMLAADADVGVPYRAPECRDAIQLATTSSDVFSLALSLSVWLVGDAPQDPHIDELRARIAGFPIVGKVLEACMADDHEHRPGAEAAAKHIRQVATAVPAQTPAAQLPPVPEDRDFHEGSLVDGRYKLIKSLGVGAFARTWLARDSNSGGHRVIKQFHDDATAKTYLHREFKAAEKIRHDHCARVYDISEKPPPGYLVLEYVEGDNLKEFAATRNPDAEMYRTIAIGVLSALDYLHARNLVHRDVSPGNVIVNAEGRAMLIDFGVSSTFDSKSLAGTPPFMAPEVRSRRGAAAQSDIYALCVTMIFVMLGRYPYAGDPARGTEERNHLLPPTDDERQSWGALGSAMLDVLFRGAHSEASRRPASARALADDLGLLDELPETEGAPLTNPTVDGLRRLYRASGIGNTGNRGLEDEFAQATYVPTLLDSKLLPDILGNGLRLVLLTGNPGDGKTSFLVKVGQALRRHDAEVVNEDAAGWRMRLNGHSYVAVYDASESHGGNSSDDLIRAALDPGPGEDLARRTVLLAINDGRLLKFFNEHGDLYEDEANEVHRQQAGKPPLDAGIVLVDLKRRTLAPRLDDAGLAGRMLGLFTAEANWEVCEGCLSRRVCPIRANADALRDPARAAVEELITTSHLRRRRRATFRDVRSAMAWLITGDRSCGDVHTAREKGMDLRRSGASLLEDLAFDRTCADYLVQEWADLDPAQIAAPEVERAARVSPNVTADPAVFTERDRERVQRRLFLGTWRHHGLERSAVRAYRYLKEFEAALHADQGLLDEAKASVLRGLSGLLGAPGYRGTALAVADQGAGGTWAVLKEIPEDDFTLDQVVWHSTYVESRPEALRLRHSGGLSLLLTLDTFELVLRVADGDLIEDAASGAVRQEIETFAAGLRHSPANSVRIVDPAGRGRRVAEVDRRLVLEEES